MAGGNIKLNTGLRTLRHDDGDILKSIELNQERFGYSDEIKHILINTAHQLDFFDLKHHADES